MRAELINELDEMTGDIASYVDLVNPSICTRNRGEDGHFCPVCSRPIPQSMWGMLMSGHRLWCLVCGCVFTIDGIVRIR